MKDALGQAGRAGTVDDVEIVERTDRHLERRVARGRQPGFEILPARAGEVVGDAATRYQLAQPRLVGLDQRTVLVGQNRTFASQSSSIFSSASAAAMVESGTTQTPARSPPMKVSRYSIELAARIAILSPRPRPISDSRRAIRLMRPSNARQFRTVPSHFTAGLSGWVLRAARRRPGST